MTPSAEDLEVTKRLTEAGPRMPACFGGERSGDLEAALVAVGQRIEIEPSLFASGDREMLQDLSAAAVNAALASAQRMVQEEMQRASSELGLPLFGGRRPT